MLRKRLLADMEDVLEEVLNQLNLMNVYILDHLGFLDMTWIGTLSSLSKFHDMNATGADFSNMKATGAEFHRSDLSSAKFDDACLDEADFNDAKLNWATFTNASLEKAKDCHLAEYAAFAPDTKLTLSKPKADAAGHCSKLLRVACEAVKEAGKIACQLCHEGADDEDDDDEEDEEDDGNNADDDKKNEHNVGEEAPDVRAELFPRTGTTGRLSGYALLGDAENSANDLLSDMMSASEEETEELADKLITMAQDKAQHTQLMQTLDRATMHLVGKAKASEKEAHLAESAVKAILSNSIDTLSRKPVTGKKHTLISCISEMKSLATKDIGQVLQKKVQRVDGAALIASMVDARLSGSVGLDRKALCTFFRTTRATIVEIERELERLKEDLAKLDVAVAAATFSDLYEQWSIFVHHTSKVKHAVTLQIMKMIATSKGNDGTPFIQHLGAVKTMIDIKNISPWYHYVRCRKSTENYNDYILKIDKELLFCTGLNPERQPC